MKFAVSSRFLYPLDVKEKGIRVVWQAKEGICDRIFLCSINKRVFLVFFVCMNTLNLESIRGTPTKFVGNMYY